MVFVIEDDDIMAECIERAVKGALIENKLGRGVRIFSNAIEAMEAISNGEIPRLIFLDVLLDGPNAFTFLNETVSYDDIKRVPVVIVSSLDFEGKDLSSYGVVGALKKESMRPEEIKDYVQEYIK